MKRELVLSLFPGIDLLGRGFQSEGFTIVEGPDTLWDSKIEDFVGVPGKFDGVIGGPPCQQYSDANRTRDPAKGDRLVLEFLRVIQECQPQWFLMENVRNVPNVAVDGYTVQRLGITDIECGGKQKRLRHIQFGSRSREIIRPSRCTKTTRSVTPAVLCRSKSNERHSRRVAKQGAPPMPLRSLTKGARSRVVGNAVPWAMACSLARAVTARSVVTPEDCVCGCGRSKSSRGIHADASCRKRMERNRKGIYRTLQYESMAIR